MIGIILVEDRLKTIHAKFHPNLPSGFGEEDFQDFPYSTYKKNKPRLLAAMFFEISL
jgi:hypothetical protein